MSKLASYQHFPPMGSDPMRPHGTPFGKSGLAYRREEDGVYVVPLTALHPLPFARDAVAFRVRNMV